MNYIEEFDKLKTKVLKYILFKKRTENEVRQKFISDQGELLNDVIDDLKENGYIDDSNYIQRAIREYMNLKNLSIKEIEYKLISKGIKKDLIENYIYNNKETLLEYEIKSAKNIIIKKINSQEKEDILNELRKKRYMEDSLKIAIQEIEE
jgi:regulatory protein